MGKGLKVLYVEEREADVEPLEKALGDFGFEVSGRRVADVQSMAEALDEDWDVALCDVRSPSLGAVHVLAMLRSRGRDLPLLVVSDALTAEEAAALLGAGARGFVSKRDLALLGPVVEKELADRSEREEKRRASEALAASEARFRAIIEDQSELIIRFDAQGLRTFANTAYCRYMDKSLGEVVGQSIWDAVHPEDAEVVRRRLTALAPENPTVVHSHRAMVRGEPRWQWWTDRAIFDADGGFVEYQSVGRDVTAERAADKTLRMNEARFASLFKLSQMTKSSLQEITEFALDSLVRLTGSEFGFLAFTDEQNGVATLHAWSSRGGRTCRVEPQRTEYRIDEAGLWMEPLRRRRPVIVNEYAGDDAAAHSLPQGHVPIDRFLGAPLVDGERVTVLAGVANKKEPYDDSDAMQMSLLLDGMWKSIEQKKAREALLSSEERYRTVADFTHDWEWWIGPDGAFIWVSPSCERYTGYSPEEFIADPGLFYRIVHEQDRGMVRKHLGAHREESASGLEFRVVRRDGQVVWISHVCQAVFGRDGRLLGRRASNRDVTLRRQYEQAVLHSERTYRAIFETTGAATMIIEDDTTISMVNGEFEKLAGYSKDEIEDRLSWCVFMAPEELPRMREYHRLRRVDASLAPRAYECRFKTRGGEYRHVTMTVSVIPGTRQSIASITDISDRKRAEDQLLYQAFYDGLTGLPNRFLFMDRLGQAIERGARRPDRTLAVLLFDLDRFKLVNDVFGRKAGDKLLQTLSERLKTSTRAMDTLARIGGDEFALLAEDLGDADEIGAVAARLQEALRQPVSIDGREVYADASIGLVTVVGGQAAQAELILRDADIAMNQAKAKGRSQCQIFSPAMREQAQRTVQTESDLRRAVVNNEFLLLYQPIVELASGRITGFEALVRWRHPTRGVLSPLEFIPVAEETGLIVPIGAWILEEACRQLKRWNGWKPRQGLTMSVNVSAKQFLQPDFAERAEDTLRQTGVDPKLLKLEITESVLMSAASSSIKIMGRLKELDVRLCVDDFGTGYSSLSYLQRFPVDILKIDRGFVSNGKSDLNNREIVQAIATLAHNLGMSVVAEGIETETQLAQLRRIGCAFGQGYLFARPLTADIAGAFLERGGVVCHAN